VALGFRWRADTVKIAPSKVFFAQITMVCALGALDTVHAPCGPQQASRPVFAGLVSKFHATHDWDLAKLRAKRATLSRRSQLCVRLKEQIMVEGALSSEIVVLTPKTNAFRRP
jgi:hypothetical protein